MDAGLLVLGQVCADAGPGVEGADACRGGAHSLHQGALRHELGLKLAGLVQLLEEVALRRVRRGGEGAADLLHAP